MMNQSTQSHLDSWSPATYRIEVEGFLEESWSDRFAGMRIRCRKREDDSVITRLTGRLRDQAELSGVLNGLTELHLSILTVEWIDEDDHGRRDATPAPSQSND